MSDFPAGSRREPGGTSGEQLDKQDGEAAGMMRQVLAKIDALAVGVEKAVGRITELEGRQDVTDRGPSIEDVVRDPPPSPFALAPRAFSSGRGVDEKKDKDVERVMRILKLNRLDPSSEKELDNEVEKWVMVAEGISRNKDVLIDVMLQLGNESVREAMCRAQYWFLDWEECWDAVARELFPFSSYVVDLEEEISREDRMCNFESMLRDLRRNIKRHARLCSRWKRINAFADYRLKEVLIKKLPRSAYVHCVAWPGSEGMGFEAFVRACQQVVAAKDKEPAEVTAKVHAIAMDYDNEEDDDEEDEDEEVYNIMAAGYQAKGKRPRVDKKTAKCHNCDEQGHFASECSKPKRRCTTCGKVGHREESCFRQDHARPLGSFTTFTRSTRKGVETRVESDPQKKALYQGLEDFYADMKEKIETISTKAKERRRIRTPEDDKKDETEEKETEEEDGDGGPMNVSSAQSSAPRVASFYADMVIFDVIVPMLLDTGADVSLLSRRVWDNIPDLEKTSMSCCTVEASSLQGVFGGGKPDLVADVPVSMNGRRLMQRFFIVQTEINLLGMDGLDNFGVDMSARKKKADMEMNDGRIIELPRSVYITPPLCVCDVFNVPTDEAEAKFGGHATDGLKKQVKDLLDEYVDVWKSPKPGTCTIEAHEIDTGEAVPIARRPRRLPQVHREAVKKQIDEMLEAGAIRESKSPWASPIVVVDKPDGGLRICIDYRDLNAVVKLDASPLPRIADLLNRLGGAEWFTTIDLKSGFHQVPLHPDSYEKTAFVTPDGHYEYLVMPFGLANAPGAFQRVVYHVFRESKWLHCIGIYLDDIVLFTSSGIEHFEVLREVFERLKGAGLFVNLKKTVFIADTIKYLGFVISGGVMTPDQSQVKCLKQLAVPRDVSGVRRFLGITGYFRQFISHFASKAKPLHELLHVNATFEWTDECQKAFECLRDELAEGTVSLGLPEEGVMFVLDTDASGHAIGAVLSQRKEKGQRLRPVHFASRALNATEQKWDVREREAYAVVWAISHFSPYLRHQAHFLVRSDHESLKWLWKMEKKRIARWALGLQEYSFTLEYNKGGNHVHADIMSRDVKEEPGAEEFVDRISASARVFVVSEVREPVAVDRSGMDVKFPSFEAIKVAQEDECTTEEFGTLQVRKGSHGAWEHVSGRLYVPKSMRDAFMFYYHFGRAGAHQGIGRSMARVSKNFWWPQMKECFRAYYATCLSCVRRRPGPLPECGGGSLVSARIGSLVAMDVIGPISFGSVSVRLLTIIDHFSKYAHVAVLEHETSSCIWEAFYREWVSMFGCPSHLLTDNASTFTSKPFQAKCASIGIKCIYAYPYHPQGNGVVEAFHQFVRRGLASYAVQTTWSLREVLATVLMAYRSTPHPTTGESPFFLLTGEDMTLPHQQGWESSTDGTRGERFVMLHTLRQECFERMVRMSVERHEARRAKQAKPSLERGDLIVYWLPPDARRALIAVHGAKLAPGWSEPCRVLRRSDKNAEAFIVKSTWFERDAFLVRADNAIRLPKSWSCEAINMAIFDLIADMRKPARQRQSALSHKMREVEPASQDRAEASIDRFRVAMEPESLIDEPYVSIAEEDSLVPDSSSCTLQRKRPRTMCVRVV